VIFDIIKQSKKYMTSTNKAKKIFTLMSTFAVTTVFAISSVSAATVAEAFGGSNLASLNLSELAATVFKILLAVAILWVVFNIVMAGIKIAGAKEDADKRKEGLKSIVNAAIGLVVALSAFLITNTVARQISTKDADSSLNNDLILPCILPTPDKDNNTNGKIGPNGTCIPK
jgi:amino acid transporter